MTMTKITEDYVSFETAKLLKEKGFDESCDYYYDQSSDEPQQLTLDEMNYSYDKFLKAPTLQMAMKWLRIKHSIHIESFCPVVDTTDEPVKYNVVISDLRNYCLAFNTPLEDKEFDSYEKACEAAIKYCLENLVY